MLVLVQQDVVNGMETWKRYFHSLAVDLEILLVPVLFHPDTHLLPRAGMCRMALVQVPIGRSNEKSINLSRVNGIPSK